MCGVELDNELTTSKQRREGSLTLNFWLDFEWISQGSLKAQCRYNLQTNFSSLTVFRLIWTLVAFGQLRTTLKAKVLDRRKLNCLGIASTKQLYSVSRKHPFKLNVGTLDECKAYILKQFFCQELKQEVVLYFQYRKFIKAPRHGSTRSSNPR